MGKQAGRVKTAALRAIAGAGLIMGRILGLDEKFSFSQIEREFRRKPCYILAKTMEITHYSEAQLSALSRELVKHGYFFYRLCFAWGNTPGIRNRTGTYFYFLHNDEILTPKQMHECLQDEWRPQTTAEVLFYQNRLVSHFAGYPKAIPEWEGIDVREILNQVEAGLEVSRSR